MSISPSPAGCIWSGSLESVQVSWIWQVQRTGERSHSEQRPQSCLPALPAPGGACPASSMRACPPNTHRATGFHSEEEEERESERASERQREAFGKTERWTKRQMQREELLGKRIPGCWSPLQPSGGGGTRVPAQQRPLHPLALPHSEPRPAALRVGSLAFLRLLPMSGPGRPVSSGLPVLLA